MQGRITLTTLSAQAQEGDGRTELDLEGRRSRVGGSDCRSAQTNSKRNLPVVGCPWRNHETDIDLAAASDAVIIGLTPPLLVEQELLRTQQVRCARIQHHLQTAGRHSSRARRSAGARWWKNLSELWKCGLPCRRARLPVATFSPASSSATANCGASRR